MSAIPHIYDMVQTAVWMIWSVWTLAILALGIAVWAAITLFRKRRGSKSDPRL